jgi:peptidoglycan/xylan/chitin deacetylase (PgdA/CDA1 family)
LVIENIYLKFRKAVSLFFLSRLHRKNITLKLAEPVVSFTFDDIPRSALANGERILRKYNYAGTYYISAGYMQRNGFDFDRTDSQVLQQVVDAGGELACHTYSHLHFFKSGREQIIADLEKNRQFIEKRVAGCKLKNFSYPFGEQTSAAREIVKSGRSVYRGINNYEVDLNCLKSVRVYETIPKEEVISMINEAIRSNGWIILYTHDVEPNPSLEGCTPGYFEEVVRYCFEKKLKVLPVNKVLDMIRN